MSTILDANVDRETVQEHGDFRTVAVDIEPTAKTAAKEQSPRERHIALCLDISGSMRWQVDPTTEEETSKLDKVKSGVRTAFADTLTDSDYVSLVAFSGESETIVPIENWGEIREGSFWDEVEALEPGGQTDIYGALEHAHEELRKPGRRDAVRRILLLTDGQHNPEDSANENPDFERLAADIDESKVSIMAAGVGNDYDRHLMKQLADASQGNWHHLESGADFEAFVTDELERIEDAVTVDPVLEVDLHPQFDAYEFTRRVGGQAQSGGVTWEDGGTTAIVPLGDLVEGETQTVTFEMTAPGREAGSEYTFATFRLRPRGTETVLAETEATVNYVEQGGLPDTGDEDGDGMSESEEEKVPRPAGETPGIPGVKETHIRDKYENEIEAAETDEELDEIEEELEEKREKNPEHEETIDDLLRKLEAAREGDAGVLAEKDSGLLTEKDD